MNAVADVRFLAPCSYEQLTPRFEAAFGVYWAEMKPAPRACFTPQLLMELRTFIDGIVSNNGVVMERGEQYAINYAVLSSAHSGTFNLGGDLALFRSAIVHRDRAQLEHYSRLCVDNLFPWHQNFDLPITTISLVQGFALGGGFEAALASTVLVAEESTRMGFPEVLFNMFPGMGAYSFLQRKVGRRTTEELITSGATYSARQLFEMGVVDVLAPDGAGEAAVYGYIRKHARGGRGRRAFEQVRKEMDAVTRVELEKITSIWVDAALNLEERDLRMMDRLVRAQEKSAMSQPREMDEFETSIDPLRFANA